MKLPIYMDYQATTPVDPRVLEEMLPYLSDHFGNAASRNHSFGWNAEKAVERARGQIAKLIGASAREIIFTSGATESDNIALKGVAEFYGRKGKHIISQPLEHKAIIDSARALEREGFEITWLPVGSDGRVDPADVERAIRPDTLLVSVMHVNNEIGVINPLKKIGQICKAKKVLFHSDAAQSVGKLPVDVEEMGVDLLSISAHKMYGPKGIGALYVRRKKPRVRVAPLIHGGGHERGMRSGTLPTHQIVGFGAAAEIAGEEMEAESQRLAELSARLWRGLKSLPEIFLNGSAEHRLPGCINISFAFIEGESLLMALEGLAVSSGSACTSASLEPSYVLRALGIDDELAHSSIRFGLGRFSTEEEVDWVINKIKEAVNRLRELSPLWEMHLEGIDLKSVNWSAH